MSKSRRLKWAEHVARLDESREDLRILTCKPIEKWLLGKPRRRLEDIRVDIKEIGVATRNWIDSASDGD